MITDTGYPINSEDHIRLAEIAERLKGLGLIKKQRKIDVKTPTPPQHLSTTFTTMISGVGWKEGEQNVTVLQMLQVNHIHLSIYKNALILLIYLYI